MTGSRAARRAFLLGRPGAAQWIRPPWALPENHFTDRCTRCGACSAACPESILVVGDGGYPQIDFQRGECTFCGTCATVCQSAAFGERSTRPWQLRVEVSDHCLARRDIHCAACRDACPSDAIRFRPRSPVSVPEVDLASCTGCGGCVAPCPAQAISLSVEQVA
ncbi:ferredoxin-type protein NapF [Tahibacter amnicola]|uniref:Ferredoxin-type protein NapF n=1 Tax=Tahibacter amnicola TaxID=2976241 RepID=A0ABY6BKQ1_9GAMM|nr:ferredoxin-type protein NapF [Tahibacter amnicola]UXI70598.1 ferredoxin-type protein NapF [Tahibacter amnicola]